MEANFYNFPVILLISFEVSIAIFFIMFVVKINESEPNRKLFI